MKRQLLTQDLLQIASKQKAAIAIVAIFILMLFFKTNFYTTYNLLEILNSVSINAVLASGVTFVILSAGCDLSIGGMMSLSGIVVILLMRIMPVVPAIMLSVLLGAGVGFINGFLVVNQKVEPFIITLGMGMLLKGIGQQITDAHPISPANSEYMMIANGTVLNLVPNLIVIMTVILIAFHIILRDTAFGRNIYAVGGDYNVAAYSGIHAARTKWLTFVICGSTAALAGVLLSSKLNSGSSIYGDSSPLFIHCGAVIGGTSLTGGKGGIIQTFIGLLALGLLSNCMNMLSITAYTQILVQGVIIVAILWFDNFAIMRERAAV